MSNQFYNDGKLAHNFKNLVGQRFGRLIVLAVAGKTKYGNFRWLCLCDCKNTRVVVGGNLHTGQIKSCGCLRNEMSQARLKKWGAENWTQPTSESQRALMFKNYQNKAKIAGREFSLTLNDFAQLTSQDCYYCGASPHPFMPIGTRYNGLFVGNGIDRVDNSRGYALDNVAPCCTNCNRGKRALSHDEFIQMAHKIAQRHPLTECSLPVA